MAISQKNEYFTLSYKRTLHRTQYNFIHLITCLSGCKIPEKTTFKKPHYYSNSAFPVMFHGIFAPVSCQASGKGIPAIQSHFNKGKAR